MNRTFNTEGYCDPEFNYMVDLSERLKAIKEMVDSEKYFTINKARQYGKTTVLTALAEYLQMEYEVISLDFQTMSSLAFESEQAFVTAFSEELLDNALLPEEMKEKLLACIEKKSGSVSLSALFRVLKAWCKSTEKKIVLMIDEVDTATNNQFFLDFLAQLRAAYLNRRKVPTFQSVILAGVYDVRNIKKKIRLEEEHKTNSPWNIAADFLVDMSFSVTDINGMLKEYEADYHTGMDIEKMAALLYGCTSGYPYLVSRLCKLLDEFVAGSEEFSDKTSAWTLEGLMMAEKRLLNENNPLFQSLTGKLADYPQLRTILYQLLFTGKAIPYVSQNSCIDIAAMFGFIKNDNGCVAISNRIFESVLYNLFISEEFITSKLYDTGLMEKNQFIVGGHLDVRQTLFSVVFKTNYQWCGQYLCGAGDP